jgi:hypothetical protein
MRGGDVSGGVTGEKRGPSRPRREPFSGENADGGHAGDSEAAQAVIFHRRTGPLLAFSSYGRTRPSGPGRTPPSTTVRC